MIPERSITVNGHLIEEFYWAGEMVVYIDHKLISLSYDNAVREQAAIA